MFKKSLFVSLIVVILSTLVIVMGCAESPPAPAPAPTPAPKPAPAPAPTPAPARIPFDQQELPEFTLNACNPGGMGQILQTGLSVIISKYSDIRASVTLIPGYVNFIEPVRRGQVDWYDQSPSNTVRAYEGGWEGHEPLRLPI